MVYGIYHGYRAPRTVPSRQLNITNYYQNCRHNSCGGGGSIFGGGSFWGGFLGGLFGSVTSLFSSFSSMPIMTGYRSTYDYLNQTQNQPGNQYVAKLKELYGSAYNFTFADGKLYAVDPTTKEAITASTFEEMTQKLQEKSKPGTTTTTTPTTTSTTGTESDDEPVTKEQADAIYAKLDPEVRQKLEAKGVTITDEGIKVGDEVIKFEDIDDIDAKLAELAADDDTAEEAEEAGNTPPAATTPSASKTKINPQAASTPTQGKTWSTEVDKSEWGRDQTFVDVNGKKFEVKDSVGDYMNGYHFKIKDGESIKIRDGSQVVAVVQQDTEKTKKGFPARRTDDGGIEVNVEGDKWISMEEFLQGNYWDKAKEIK